MFNQIQSIFSISLLLRLNMVCQGLMSALFRVGWRFCSVCDLHPTAVYTSQLFWDLLQVREMKQLSATHLCWVTSAKMYIF